MSRQLGCWQQQGGMLLVGWRVCFLSCYNNVINNIVLLGRRRRLINKVLKIYIKQRSTLNLFHVFSSVTSSNAFNIPPQPFLRSLNIQSFHSSSAAGSIGLPCCRLAIQFAWSQVLINVINNTFIILFSQIFYKQIN